MMFEELFWENIVNVWISIQTKEESEKTKNFAEKLAEKEINSAKEKVISIEDELFG